MSYIYDIEVPLAGSDQWYAVCRCLSAVSVGSIITELCRSSNGRPIRVNPILCDDEPARRDAVPPAGFP